MKRIIIMIITGFVLCQPANGQRLRSEWVKMTIALPAADEFYGKEKRFQTIVPENIGALAQLTDKYAGGVFAKNHLMMPISAKMVNTKKGETPDIVFEIISPGILNAVIGQPYITQYNKYLQGITSVTVKGFVSDITYNFPMKILIKDGQGNLKRTIIISDATEKFQMTYHAAYLKEKELHDKSLVFPPAVFGSVKDYKQSLEETKKEDIITRTAKNQLAILFDACSEAIRICYDNYLSRKNFIVYIDRLNEWKDPASAALSEAVDAHKAALQITYNEESMSSLSQSLQPVISVYENYLQEYGATVKNLRKLCLYNLLPACYFSGDFDKAAQYYEAYYREFGSLTKESDIFFNKIYAWYQLKQSDTSYFAANFLESVENAVIEKRLEAESQKASGVKEIQDAAYSEVHIRGAGTLTDINGEKHNGEIAIDFVSEGSIVNLDAGRLVTLHFENQVQTFGLKQFIEVDVEGVIYRPVKKASRLVSSSTIMKLIHQKGKYSLLHDPKDKIYYLKSDAMEKAYPVHDVLQTTKLGEEFHQSCPTLKTELSAWEKPAGIDRLKELIDKIEQLCQ
ncbi:MAG: hypothetical protein LBS43_10265 [Prevotellaceae bacterium]|jgi:hypothetical protein|nr:hypothetical protein [Prevotellaceae bacterium]